MNYRAALCFMLSVLGVEGIALSRAPLDPYEQSTKLRREIEVTPAFFFARPTFELPTEKFSLPVGPVFDQGASQYCWAYAGFHTLRTFYGHSPYANDEKRKEFLLSFASTADYKNWVFSQVGSLNEAGWPIEAVYFYDRNLGGAPTPPWISLVPSSTQTGWNPHPPPDLHEYTPQAFFTSIKDISSRIYKGLTQGAPASFCTTTHCVTIYGGEYVDGNPTTYQIADSAGGGIYTASANSVHGRIADITALDLP